jgi:hypothetical protein
MAIKDDYYVVDFQFIDDVRCIRPLSEAVRDPHQEEADSVANLGKEEKLRSELGALFLAAGWEGDGEINCIFLPPCFLAREDGWCIPVYHVKQSNDGISWLAIPRDMKLSMPKGMFVKR